MKRLLMIALLVVAAAPAPPLRPGLWEQRNEPGKATLDGKPLEDLPLDPIRSDRVCLTPAEAANPARWLARDLSAACRLDRTTLGAGSVDIAGSCPSPDAGGEPGHLTIRGTAAADSFDVTFATKTKSPIGTMGFSGRMVGRRIGACDPP